MKKTLIYTACVAALSSSNAFAQSQGTGELQGCIAEPDEKVTNVYFGNGVDNTLLDAKKSTAYLKIFAEEDVLPKLGSDAGTFNFLRAYNPTEGLLKDLAEVTDQRFRLAGLPPHISGLRAARLYLDNLHKTAREHREKAKKYWDYSRRFDLPGSVAAAINEEHLARYDEILAEEYKKQLVEKTIKLHERLNRISPTERKHIALYTSDLLAGKRVFVVAHSQGNLFANIALKEVMRARPDEASSLAMIGVGTPAAPGTQFAGRQAQAYYRTAHDDQIIDLLRARTLWDVLPSNINNDLTTNTAFAADFVTRPLETFTRAAIRMSPIFYWFVAPTGNVITPDTIVDQDRREPRNHSFISAYMAYGLPSASDIASEMQRLAKDVPFPTREAGEGAIRATLTWDAQPDVDLHAFEPNGSHVYYRSRTGRSGTLDVDDTSSYGPENYFVPCNKVELGTYRIGVNYFDGSGPSTAIVALFLGDGTIPSPKKVVLPAWRGEAGDGSPQILFTIQVTENVDPQTQKRSAVYTVQ